VKATATGGIMVSGRRSGGRDADVEPRVSIVTLGVGDLGRAVAFYRDGLGWPRSGAGEEDIAFFRTGGVVLALPRPLRSPARHANRRACRRYEGARAPRAARDAKVQSLAGPRPARAFQRARCHGCKGDRYGGPLS
jgi:catechol 2,3-dioxygenase-like lactoylglutathione lyase family enzyme